MAKYIDGPDGSRLLVSDDAPDGIMFSDDENHATDPDYTGILSLVRSAASASEFDSATAVIQFSAPAEISLTLQLDTYKAITGTDDVFLAGTMLLQDFGWLAENRRYGSVSNVLLDIPGELEEDPHTTAKLASGKYGISEVTAKEMSAISVKVKISLKKHT